MKLNEETIHPDWVGWRRGRVGGKDVLITHRNPETGELWCEHLNEDPNRTCWVNADKVEIL